MTEHILPRLGRQRSRSASEALAPERSGGVARKAPSQSRSGSRSPICASAMMRCTSAARMGSSQAGVAPSEASAISRAIPIRVVFAVELMTVEVRSDGHGKLPKAPRAAVLSAPTRRGSTTGRDLPRRTRSVRGRRAMTETILSDRQRQVTAARSPPAFQWVQYQLYFHTVNEPCAPLIQQTTIFRLHRRRPQDAPGPSGSAP